LGTLPSEATTWSSRRGISRSRKFDERKTPKKTLGIFDARNLCEENADNETFARIGDGEDRRVDVLGWNKSS